MKNFFQTFKRNFSLLHFFGSTPKLVDKGFL